MNDIQILQEMLSRDAQVELEQGKRSVVLTDPESKDTVKIMGVPPDSIVIRAEIF